MRQLFWSTPILILLWAATACQNPATDDSSNDEGIVSETPSEPDTPVTLPPPPPPLPDTSDLERELISQGLVNILDYDSSVVVRMMYSTNDNFLGEDVYADYDECYLQPEVAQKLTKAEELLIMAHPDLRLIVFDCVRPRSVQYQMWEIVKGTDQQRYVAAPGGSGSMHNYGAAVDLGLYHIDSGLVDMGTPFDFFGPLAQPRYETQFLQSGELTQVQINHRAILRTAMKEAGFQGIMSEWWHFIGFGRDEVRSRYTIVE